MNWQRMVLFPRSILISGNEEAMGLDMLEQRL